MRFPIPRRSPGARPATHARRKARLELERLDDRCLLSSTAGFTAEAPAGKRLFGTIDTKPLTVVNNRDSGAGSLRDAIATADSGDSIVFDPSLAGQTTMLTSSELAITKSLDIEGLGGTEIGVSSSFVAKNEPRPIVFRWRTPRRASSLE